MSRPRVYLDIDIDGARAAHARAKAFVAGTNLKYGWSSPDIADLGGSERARVLDAYSEDYDWAGRGRCLLDPPAHERLTVELFADAAPNAAANFAALCAGDRGLAKGSGVRLHYKGSRFHRVVRGFVAPGGDFVFSNGTGGESSWGGTFKDERGGLALKHDVRGLLSMCNRGKNSNGSQFFITLGPARALDGKHVVFGRCVEGCEVLDAIEAAGRERDDDAPPAVPIAIVDCGVL